MWIWSLFKPMKEKGDGSCLYRAAASHVLQFYLNDLWTNRFLPGKKPGIKLATFELVNDLKQFLSQKDNDILQKSFDVYEDEEINDFIKEKVEELVFALEPTEMN